MATLLKKNIYIYIYIYIYIEPEPRCKLIIWKTDVLNFNHSLLKYGHPAKKKNIYIYIYIYTYIYTYIEPEPRCKLKI